MISYNFETSFLLNHKRSNHVFGLKTLYPEDSVGEINIFCDDDYLLKLNINS